MAINLADKYAGKIEKRFAQDSYFTGKVSSKYEFEGVRTLRVYTPVTVKPVDYNRTASANRYGQVTELQDTVQEMVMSQDKSFTFAIDNGNNKDQMNSKKAGEMLQEEIRQEITPMMDTYILDRFAHKAGQIVELATAPTEDVIIKEAFNASAALLDAKVPTENVFMYVPTDIYNLIRLSSQIMHLEGTGVKALTKGEVGMLADMHLVVMPKSYFPKDVYFVVAYKESVIAPTKIKKTMIHENPVGIDGNVVEGRYYHDAFVLEAKANGVYTAVKKSTRQATPTVSPSGAQMTLASSASDAIWYTIDGSDPRYSMNKQLYASPVTLEDGQTIKAYAVKAGKFDSAVAEHTYNA